MSINIFWDQDHTLLRGDLKSDKLEANSSVNQRLSESNYRNFFFSNKAEWATWKKAEICNIKDHFSESFDSRIIPGSKSIQPYKSWSTLDISEIIRDSVYIGDNLDHDLVLDAPGLVHIIDPNAIHHDINIYFKILDYLKNISNSSFSESFETEFKNKSVGYCNIDGINVLFQPMKLKNTFSARPNWEDYETQNIEGSAYVILVAKVDHKYNVNLDEYKI